METIKKIIKVASLDEGVKLPDFDEDGFELVDYLHDLRDGSAIVTYEKIIS